MATDPGRLTVLLAVMNKGGSAEEMAEEVLRRHPTVTELQDAQQAVLDRHAIPDVHELARDQVRTAMVQDRHRRLQALEIAIDRLDSE